MKLIRVNVEMRIPGRLSYQFFHVSNIPLEVSVPKEYIVNYPDDDIIYLTAKGLAYLDRELARVLREEKMKEYTEKDVEEGWGE